MRDDRANRRFWFGLVTFGVTLFVGLWHLSAVAHALQVAFSMISFVLLGLAIAFLINAPMRLIETKLFALPNRRLGARWQKIRRPLSLALALVLVLAGIFTIVFMIIPETGRTFVAVGNQVPRFLTDAKAWLDGLGLPDEVLPELSFLAEIDWASLGNAVIDWLKNGAGNLLVGTFNVASSVISGVANLLLGVVLAMYILIAKEKLGAQTKRALYAYLPGPRVDRALAIGQQANRIFSGFLGGQFLEAVILSLLFYVGMVIFGFPFAPMISVLIGATSLIPIFGAFIGFFIGVFMILVNQGIVKALWFAVFFLVIQQVEGSFIYPHVVGKSVKLPGMWVMIAVTLGGNIAGVLGMIISVPVASLLYALFREAVAQRTAQRDIGQP